MIVQFETDLQCVVLWQSLLKSVANCVSAYFPPPKKEIDAWKLYHLLFPDLSYYLGITGEFLCVFIIDNSIWDERRKLPGKKAVNLNFFC